MRDINQALLAGFAGIKNMRFKTNIGAILLLVLFPVMNAAGHGVVSAICVQEPTITQLMQDAQVSLDRGDLSSAVRQLEQVLALDASHKAARIAIAHLLMRLGRWKDADHHVQLLRGRFPGETEPLYLAALIAFERGQMEQVCELAEQALARGDRRVEIFKLLALAEYLLQRLDKFEAHIREAIKINPLDPDANYHLGRYFFEDKQYSAALNYFQTVLRLKPQHYKAHYYSGLVYEGQNEMEKAKEEFQTAIQIVDRLKVRYAWPFTELGERLINEGEYERGLGWLYRAVRNDPASPHARYTYAKALFQKGLNSEIKETLLAAIRLDPGYSDAYYLLARYYQKCGDKELAKETFARFEELKKNPIPSPYGLRRW
jgi:tetratricopeptide (TPR) repeat protein